MAGYVGAKTRQAEYENYSRKQLDDILQPVLDIEASKLTIDENLSEIAANGTTAQESTRANLGKMTTENIAEGAVNNNNIATGTIDISKLAELTPGNVKRIWMDSEVNLQSPNTTVLSARIMLQAGVISYFGQVSDSAATGANYSYLRLTKTPMIGSSTTVAYIEAVNNNFVTMSGNVSINYGDILIFTTGWSKGSGSIQRVRNLRLMTGGENIFLTSPISYNTGFSGSLPNYTVS